MHIQHAMCEGICDRCREKVQWKFNYGKYKPLTRPGSCRDCKNKTVTKAYRTWCDPCAAKEKKCAACGGNIVKLNNVRRQELLERGLIEQDDEEDDEGEENDEGSDEEVVNKVAAKGSDDDGSDDEGSDEECDESTSAAESEVSAAMVDSVFQVTDKDIRKFDAYGASKYDKNRVVGSNDDAALVEDLKKF